MFPDSGRFGNMCAAPELEKLASASRLPAALADLVFQIKCLVRDRPVRGVRGDSCLLMRILLVMGVMVVVVRPDGEATVGSKAVSK